MRSTRVGVVGAMLAAASVGMRGLGVAIESARDSFEGFARDLRTMQKASHRNIRSRRHGSGTRRLPTGRPGWIAPYATVADAERAIRRAERWERAHPGAHRDEAPGHIFRNARHAADQINRAKKAAS